MAPGLCIGERSNEATAGGIDVYRDVMPGLLLKFVENDADLFYRLIVAGVCRSQNHENAYSWTSALPDLHDDLMELYTNSILVNVLLHQVWI